MILIKEEFVGGPKYRRAVTLGGSDAIAMWLALKCYCSQHPDTQGFVPAEDLAELPGAPRRSGKALQALIDCGRLLPGGERGAGLVEATEGGWQMHDYGDHAPAPEETELRREKARLRQQAHRENKRRELAAVKRLRVDLAQVPAGEGVTQPVTPGARDNPCDLSRDAGGVSPPGGRPREGAPTRAGALPSPTLPNPPQPNLKTLRGLSSTIRDPRGRTRTPAPLGPEPPEDRPPEAAAALEISAAHRQFAADYGVDPEAVLAELESDPGTAELTPAEVQTRLAARLITAASQRVGAA
jgi:hypothetical protein